MRVPSLGLWVSLVLVMPGLVQAQPQDAADVKRTRLKDKAADFWIYDDIDKGYALAADTKKPLLVSFRCVP
jgi:hypothetical protein